VDENFFAGFRKAQEAKRKAVLGDVQIAEKTPTCTCGLNMVKNILGDFWCPMCKVFDHDLRHDKIRRKEHRQRRSAAQQEARQETIKATNELDPLRRFIRHLTVKMLDDKNLQHSVIFANINGGDHRVIAGGKHQIRFGYVAVIYFGENGYTEYKTWRHLWSGTLTGKKAMWAMAIHEVAHALQSERNGRYRGSQHNQIWANAVRELQAEYPYEQVKGLF
jgi:hypothetical protein